MMLAIAFLMFAMLMLAWLTMPDSEPEALPTAKPLQTEAEPAGVTA